MAEVVGAISGALTITSALTWSLRELRTVHQVLRYANDEVEEIKLSLKNNLSLSKMFGRAMQEASKVKGCLGKRNIRRLERNLEKEAESIKARICRLLDTLNLLRRDGDIPRALLWVGKIQWYWNRDRVLLLHASMDSLQSSMNLFSNIVTLTVLLSIVCPSRSEINQM